MTKPTATPESRRHRYGKSPGRTMEDWGLAVDMAMFQFGPRRSAVVEAGPKRGQTVDAPSYSLHVQCGWRMRRAGRVSHALLTVVE